MKRILFTLLFLVLPLMAQAEILSPSVRFYPGDLFAITYTVHDATGSAANSSATPTITIVKSGTLATGISTAQVNHSAGLYSLTFTVPSTWRRGAILEVAVTATVNGVTGKAVIYRRRIVGPADSRD